MACATRGRFELPKWADVGKDEQGKGAATFRAWTATKLGMDFTLWISETALVPSLGI